MAVNFWALQIGRATLQLLLPSRLVAHPFTYTQPCLGRFILLDIDYCYPILVRGTKAGCDGMHKGGRRQFMTYLGESLHSNPWLDRLIL